uniref:prostate stem cell antigen-like isoform X2 n=1 Tax=Monopterus albus TaxID=43700 RepID=UPI0009B386F7|nr:prostate stem cell antigen-like isoform X2 [Monopterus albus]
MTLFVTVESLTCYKCDTVLLGACLGKSSINCTEDQKSCFTAHAKFSPDLLDIHDRGCIEDTKCKNSTGTILNFNYVINMTCCNKDLCNGATSIQMPLATALCAALVAMWSQWGL